LYGKISENITIHSALVDKFKEIYDIITVVRQFGYKRGNVPS